LRMFLLRMFLLRMFLLRMFLLRMFLLRMFLLRMFPLLRTTPRRAPDSVRARADVHRLSASVASRRPGPGRLVRL